MQFTFKFAVLAFLAQAAVIAAFPLEQGHDSDLEARGPTKRPTQQECEVACTLAGLQGAAWNQCVSQCMASNYPSPPPSPQNRPAQQVRPAGKPAARPAPKVKAGKRDVDELEARGPTKRPTQQECEVACTLAGFQGAAWNQPAQQAKPAERPAPKGKAPMIKAGKRDVDELEARGPTKRPTQQECEVACTLAGFQGAAWNQCVSQCMASNYPTPPPSPHNRPAQPARPAKPVGRPATKIKAGKREVEGTDEE
ncbi:hypothetical protein AB1N83_005332 [Pleurotus pulmonarius]